MVKFSGCAAMTSVITTLGATVSDMPVSKLTIVVSALRAANGGKSLPDMALGGVSDDLSAKLNVVEMVVGSKSSNVSKLE